MPGQRLPARSMCSSRTPPRPAWPSCPSSGAGYIHTVKCRHQDAVRRGLECPGPASAAQRRPVRRRGPASPTCTAMRSPRWHCARPTGSLATRSSRARAAGASTSSSRPRTPTTGGWRYSPGQAGDTSVFGWQIFALRSGHLAGLSIPRTTLPRLLGLSQPGGRRPEEDHLLLPARPTRSRPS